MPASSTRTLPEAAPIQSSAGQGPSNNPTPHPVRALPSFPNPTAVIRRLPPRTVEWPSAQSLGFTGPVPSFPNPTTVIRRPPPRTVEWPSVQSLDHTGPVPVLSPVRNTEIPAALQPGYANLDTRTHAQDSNVNFEPLHQAPPGMYNQSTLQRTNQDGPYPHIPARQKSTVQATAGPPMTILPRPRASSDMSPPLPNPHRKNFPMSEVRSGREITIEGPYWDEGRKQPLSGDKSYLTIRERNDRRIARKIARDAVAQYKSPEWLAQASDSEDESDW
ncbi:MAG: hypothetical protein LQ339_006674 [Xanthoria mediterranea]|nr:MAG: hypothetical protein LQ339_006674 [Xanthoria mediterranea]